MEFRSDREIRKLLARGRRKGQAALRKAIRAAVEGGPEQLLDALNLIHFQVPVQHAAAIDLTRVSHTLQFSLSDWSKEHLPIRPTTEGSPFDPLVAGLLAIREMADCTIQEAAPRCQGACDHLKVAIRSLWNLVTDLDERLHSPGFELGGRRFVKAVPRVSRQAFDSFARNCEAVVNLLLTFWAAPEKWLRRLRKCRYPKCRRPYFLDRSIREHAKFCSAKHRLAAFRAARPKGARPGMPVPAPHR